MADRTVTLNLTLNDQATRALQQALAATGRSARGAAAGLNMRQVAPVGSPLAQAQAAQARPGAGGKGIFGDVLGHLGLGGLSGAGGFAGAAAAVGVLYGTAQKLKGLVEGWVQLAAPGVMKRFKMTIEDIGGVLGHTFRPVIEFVTKEFRLIGDFLAGILPTGREMESILKPYHEALENVREALADLAPTIKEVLKYGLENLGVVLKTLAGVVKFVTETLKSLGLIKGGKSLPSSIGAAARQAHFTTPEEYAKSVYQAAFNQGKEPQVQTAENTKGIWDTLKGMAREIGSFVSDAIKETFRSLVEGWEKLQGIGREIGSFVSDAIKETFRSLGEGFGKLQDAFAGLGGLADLPDRIPNAIRDALNDLPERIADAIRDALPSLPSLPGGGNGSAHADAARAATRGWLGGVIPGGGLIF